MDSLTPPVPPAPTFPSAQRGFTLTEMAVVMAIIALLIGGMILPISAQQDIRTNTETERMLADAREALLGYAASHTATDGKPHLPCPDTDGDGVENRSGSACVSPVGDLPWADLGLGRQDAWGNALRYAVAGSFSDNAAGFTLLPTGTLLRVCEDNACATVLAISVPAVILSRGKNGGATPTDIHELENTDVDNDFVQRTHDGSFDDVVLWLPTPILINRMISAGKLP